MGRGFWSHSPEVRKAAYRTGRFAVDKESTQAQHLMAWWPLGHHGGTTRERDYGAFHYHGTYNGTTLPNRVRTHHPFWGDIPCLNFESNQAMYISATSTPFRLPATTSQLPFTVYWNVHIDAYTDARAGMLNLRMNDGNTAMSYISFSDSNVVTATESNNMRVRMDDDVTDEIVGGWHSFCHRFNGGDFDTEANHDMAYDGKIVSTSEWAVGVLGSNITEFGRAWAHANYELDGKLSDIRAYDTDLPNVLISEIHYEPWRLAHPLGVRKISLAPAAGITAGEIVASLGHSNPQNQLIRSPYAVAY